MESQEGVLQAGIFEMVTGSGPVVFGVLIILIILSVWSWTITISKMLQLKRAKAESEEFSALFWETRNLSRVDDSSHRLSSSPLARVFSSGYRELNHLTAENQGAELTKEEIKTVESALKRAEYEEGLRLERGVTFLATVASAAPFIGLFGTVWGIMNAFHGLSSASTTTLQAVAPGISEALVATAIGLAAAIPAAVAYNYFAVAIRNARESMMKFRSEFITFARQYYINGNRKGA